VRITGAFVATALVLAALAGLALSNRDNRNARDDLLFGYNDDAVLAGVLTARQDARLAAQAGANSARISLDWRSLEPRRDTYNFVVYDRIYRAMLARGIRPLLTLVAAPSWTWGSEQACRQPVPLCRFPPSPAYDGEWRQVAAMAARRYPKAAGIEIWNEPNLRIFWSGRPDPGRYVRLLKQAYGAIKRANPSMAVIGGSMNNVDTAGAGDMPLSNFARAMYAEGAAEAMDAVSVHPYPTSGTDSSRMLRDIELVRRAGGAGRRRPLWITEVGLATSGRVGAGVGVSDNRQALGLRSLLRLLSAMKDVHAVYVHKLLDRTIPGVALDSGYGVVRPDLTRKPAFCTLARERGRDCGG
jgi:hypothetical protein